MSSHGSSTRGFGVRGGVAALFSVVLFSGVASAQEAPRLSLHAEALARVSELGSVPLDSRGVPRPTSFQSLYVTFGMLQAIDAHATIVALRKGGREANPLMGGVAGHPAALIAVKTASGLGTLYFVEKLRKKNRVAAAITMAAIDSAYAMIVMHNARVASGLTTR